MTSKIVAIKKNRMNILIMFRSLSTQNKVLSDDNLKNRWMESTDVPKFN